MLRTQHQLRSHLGVTNMHGDKELSVFWFFSCQIHILGLLKIKPQNLIFFLNTSFDSQHVTFEDTELRDFSRIISFILIHVIQCYRIIIWNKEQGLKLYVTREG